MNNYWLFQNNPRNYDLQLCLKKCKKIHWKTNCKKLAKEDIAYFFECGGKYHICAKGKIVSKPSMMNKSECEKSNKCLKKEFEEDIRVAVEITRVFDPPIKIKDMEEHLKSNEEKTVINNIIKKDKSLPGSCFRMVIDEVTALDEIITKSDKNN